MPSFQMLLPVQVRLGIAPLLNGLDVSARPPSGLRSHFHLLRRPHVQVYTFDCSSA